MAGRKSNAVKAAEAAAKAAEAAKTAENDPKAESIKAEEKKAASTTTRKAATKTTAKTATAASSKKAEKECTMHIQFAGKSYSQEDLMKMAKDVWKYDLKQKVGDLASVELYVKPEENKVYYVMNGEFTGDFSI